MNAAPLLISYHKVESYLEALPEPQQVRYAQEISRLAEANLPPVVSPYCLAILFGYSLEFIHALSKQQYKFYRTFTIKKGKKVREIQAPKVALKVIQKWIGHHLCLTIKFPEHVFGFIPETSARMAAKQHCNAKWLYSIDIKDFFPSISEELVSAAFQKIGYSEIGSQLAASLCCFNGFLAQGSPASPVLSNLVMKDVDGELKKLGEELGVTVTRYADDIVFSGKGVFPDNLKLLVGQIFKNTGLELNADKEYFADSLKGQRLKVHGLLVNGDKPRLTKGYRNKIRAYKHLLEAGKVSNNDLKRLNGHINYAESIDL
ncbi:MAG: reverse transcriptase family protein [Cocleimonas sp.]|jgi:RNA-directed DNA polymerase